MTKDLLRECLTKLNRGDAPDHKYPDGKGEYWTLCPFHADHLDLPIRGVRLRCPDGTVYEAGVELFQRHGFAFDRGHGRQVALPLQFWRVTRAGEPVQLSLLEVST